MLSSMDINFATSVTDATSPTGVIRVPWTDQILRMSHCDVIVDQIKPSLGMAKFGEWVSIATEAAMLGKIPIANSLDTKPYEKTYGRKPGIHICNTPDELKSEVERLAALSADDLKAEQAAVKDWAVSCHSMRATSAILKHACAIDVEVAA
jgi:hypothetical protein